MLKLKLNNEYEEIEQNENGLSNLKLGVYTKYRYFHKEKSAGFLIKIIYPELAYLKNDIKLLFKQNNNFIELPFYKYIFLQKTKKKSYFNSIDEKNNILNNTKKLLEKINSNNQ